MGSGPGPERIGSGRHRLCGARVLLQPRSEMHPGISALPKFFVCFDSRFSCVLSGVELPLQTTCFARRIMKCAPTLSLNPEPNGFPTTV